MAITFDQSKEPISWLQKEFKEGTLKLRPPYQRKPVWAAKQKCYLIESILMGMPVPEIFVHEETNEDGQTIHAVVDGQQRVRTVLQFLGLNTQEDGESDFVGLALDKFDHRAIQSPWLGMRFADLSIPDKKKFFSYRFHLRLLRSDREADLRDMFARLNRYLTPLNAQELRHATYTGPFVQLSEELAETDYWLESGLISPTLIRRFGDVEYVSQLLIGIIHGPEGGSASVVNDYYRQYEDFDIDEGIPNQRRIKQLFLECLSHIQKVFPDLSIKNTRWGNRTDFYSLFVGLAEISREGSSLANADAGVLRAALERFAADVDRKLSNPKARVRNSVSEYVRAAEKGANDRARRVDRHRIVVTLLEDILNLSARSHSHSTPKNSRGERADKKR